MDQAGSCERKLQPSRSAHGMSIVLQSLTFGTETRPIRICASHINLSLQQRQQCMLQLALCNASNTDGCSTWHYGQGCGGCALLQEPTTAGLRSVCGVACLATAGLTSPTAEQGSRPGNGRTANRLILSQAVGAEASCWRPQSPLVPGWRKLAHQQQLPWIAHYGIAGRQQSRSQRNQAPTKRQ
jgi:hypothetical protein